MGSVARVASGVSQESLLALLEAGSASPTACHRLASLALIFDSVMKRTRTGPNQATPDLLPKLVEAARREDRKIRKLEDFIPHDARLEVEVRWDGSVHRMLPGSLDQPVGMVENLRMLAYVVDPVLVEHVEFGLADVVELVLRRVGHVASVLAPTWSTRQEVIGTPPRVSDRELAAAETLLDISNQVASCRNPDRARVALEIFSVSPEQLMFNPSGGETNFGSILGVRKNPDKIVPLPAGILIDCLSEVGGRLAEIACRFDPDVERRWKHKMERGIAYMLAGSGHPIGGPVETPDGGEVHSAILYSERQVVALDVVANLQQVALLEGVAESTENLNKAAQGAELTFDGDTMPISSDAQVVTLQIVAHPDRNPPSDDHPSMHLRGFMRLIRTTARNPQDLWYFLRDLNDFTKTTRVFSVDLLDAWEMWRAGEKSFPLGSIPFGGMLVSPFWGGEVEWEAAARSAPVERALLTSEEPQLSAWPIIDIGDDGAYLGDKTRNAFCQVLPWDVPVVVSMTDFRDRSPDGRTLWAFAEGIVWKLRHMRESFHAAADLSGIKALKVGFLRYSTTDSDPLHIAERDGSFVVLGWNSDLLQWLEEDSLSVEALTGRLLSEAFDSPAANETFIAGWDKAPPGVRRGAMPFPSAVQPLPAPTRSHPSQIADLNRRLGEHLLASDIKPGTYQGDDAKKIASEVIYRWALKELHRIIHPYNAQLLLEQAIWELERANHERWGHIQMLALIRGFPVHADLTPGSPEDRREEIVQLCKAISLVLEETLARPPNGNAIPDHLLWSQVLPVAQFAYTSAFRSETLHLRLNHAEITVTDRYEVHFHESDEPTDVDMAAYNKQRATATLPGPIPISVLEGESPKRDPKPWGEHSPELAELDSTLKSDMGFGLDALIGVLGAAIITEGTPEKPFATPEEVDLADAATELIEYTTREECLEAIRWLTLTQESLQAEDREYWETERRSARIDTRPLVEHESRRYVLPWTAAATLSVLFNYLEEGRLPWPDAILPPRVVQALQSYRDRKNKQFEKDCSDALAETELRIIRNLKEKAAKRRYGFDSLYGEIDLLCVDVENSRIWVVEAKDPVTPFSAQQVRQSITSFYKPKGYVDKLIWKTEDVQRNASNLANALDIGLPDREWEVRCLIVTRHPNPAAFAVSSQVPFCTIAELEDFISGG